MRNLSVRKAARNLLNQATSPDVTESPNVTDRWEMKSDSIEYQDMIGKGAFGKVYSAEVEINNMSLMFKQTTYKHNMKKYQENDARVKVAVKVLKGDQT